MKYGSRIPAGISSGNWRATASENSVSAVSATAGSESPSSPQKSPASFSAAAASPQKSPPSSSSARSSPQKSRQCLLLAEQSCPAVLRGRSSTLYPPDQARWTKSNQSRLQTSVLLPTKAKPHFLHHLWIYHHKADYRHLPPDVPS